MDGEATRASDWSVLLFGIEGELKLFPSIVEILGRRGLFSESPAPALLTLKGLWT